MFRKHNEIISLERESHIAIPSIFQHYMDNLDEPCGIKNKESTFIYANQAYHELLNLPKGFDIIGRKDNELPAPTAEYAGLFQAHDRLVEKTGKRRTSLEIHPFGREQQLNAYFFDKTPYPDDFGNTVGTFFHGRKAEHLPLGFYTHGEQTGSLLLTLPNNLFTEAEWIVIFYLRSHFSRKEIAQQLKLSEGYVKNIIAIIYEKAGVTSNKMLIDFVRVNGWYRYIPEKLLVHHHRLLP